MSGGEHDLPFIKLARTFQIDAEVVNAAVREGRASSAWSEYVLILSACRKGDFSGIARLPSLMAEKDDYFFWSAASNLLGYAGQWQQIFGFYRTVEQRLSESGVQYFLAIALGTSCNIEAVPLLLKVHEKAEDEESRHQVENHLSFLLEEDNGPIWAGADESLEIPDDFDAPNIVIVHRQPYFELVQAALAQVEPQAADRQPIYEGKTYDLLEVSRTLLERLRSDDNQLGRINRERIAFEAATGIDTGSFYNDSGTLLRLAGAAIIEEFLESDAASMFPSGQRYFCGHRITV
jgi:hypothetical protein